MPRTLDLQAPDLTPRSCIGDLGRPRSLSVGAWQVATCTMPPIVGASKSALRRTALVRGLLRSICRRLGSAKFAPNPSDLANSELQAEAAAEPVRSVWPKGALAGTGVAGACAPIAHWRGREPAF